MFQTQPAVWCAIPAVPLSLICNGFRLKAPRPRCTLQRAFEYTSEKQSWLFYNLLLPDSLGVVVHP